MKDKPKSQGQARQTGVSAFDKSKSTGASAKILVTHTYNDKSSSNWIPTPRQWENPPPAVNNGTVLLRYLPITQATSLASFGGAYIIGLTALGKAFST